MPDMNYSSGPGGYTLTTGGSPGVAGQGYAPGSNQDLLDFYKEMARRALPPRAAAPRAAAPAAMPSTDWAGPSLASAAPMPAAERITPSWFESQGAATRPVGLGPQMIPGMGVDPHLLPPSMRPEAAGVSYAPSVVAGARRTAENDAAFDDRLDAERARTRGQAGEVGGAAPGTPGGAVLPRGTAPMLTPANAVVPGAAAAVDPYERIRRAGLNSMYGR